MKTVLLIGTLDTKGREIAYLRDRVRALGLGTLVLDSGILGEPLGCEADISRAEVARAGGRANDPGRRADCAGPAGRSTDRRADLAGRRRGRGTWRGGGKSAASRL